MNPLERRIAFRSHCSPNASRRPPTTSRKASIGIRVRAGPSAATTAASASAAAATPVSAERQPRVTPTASTIVSASTISTAQARNAARNRRANRTAEREVKRTARLRQLSRAGLPFQYRSAALNNRYGSYVRTLPALLAAGSICAGGFGLLALAFERPSDAQLTAAAALRQLQGYRLVHSSEVINGRRMAVLCEEGWFHLGHHHLHGDLLSLGDGTSLFISSRRMRI